MENKFQINLKEAKDSERVYITNINNANFQRENYIENMKKTMNEFQNLEEKCCEFVKDTLRKYIVYQVAYIRNLQYDIEKKANVNYFIKFFLDNGKYKYSIRYTRIYRTEFY